MTREQQIDWLCRLKSEIKIFMPYQWQKPFEEALDMAIKAPDQEPNKSENPTSSDLSSGTRKNSEKLEKGTDYTWEDVSSVIDAMEYRTNSLIENIKSEILHFANAHCSGDDINIYDAIKVIDDCCEDENSTTKNNLALIHTEGLDVGIRCAMCTNSIKSDRGCDGGCVVNNAMYKEVMDVIENHIVDTDKMVEPTTKNGNEKFDAVMDNMLEHPSTTKNNLVVDCIPRNGYTNIRM